LIHSVSHKNDNQVLNGLFQLPIFRKDSFDPIFHHLSIKKAYRTINWIKSAIEHVIIIFQTNWVDQNYINLKMLTYNNFFNIKMVQKWILDENSLWTSDCKKCCKIIRVRWKWGHFWVTQQCPNVTDKLLRRTFEHESWNSYRQLHTVTFDQMLKGNKRAYIHTKINAIFESKNSTYFWRARALKGRIEHSKSHLLIQPFLDIRF